MVASIIESGEPVSRNCILLLAFTISGLRGMNGGIHQLASALLALAFAAVMLVTGLLYIERSGRPFEVRVPASAVLSLANESGAFRTHK